MYCSSEMNSFVPECSVSIPLPLRDLSGRCQSCGCSFGRAAALHAERDRCAGAGQRCGEAAGGNLIVGPEGAGRSRALNQFHFKVAAVQGSQNAYFNVYNLIMGGGGIDTGYQLCTQMCKIMVNCVKQKKIMDVGFQQHILCNSTLLPVNRIAE